MGSRQYEDKANHYFGLDRNEMLPFVPADSTAVLEVGCGTGLFATAVKTKLGARVVGIEPFQHAAMVAAKSLDEVLALDVDDGVQKLAG